MSIKFGRNISIEILYSNMLKWICVCVCVFSQKWNEAVQEERGPRKQKPIIQSNIFNDVKHPVLSSKLISKSMPTVVEANQTLNFNVMAQILIACVKQAKLNEYFQQLPLEQQKIILKQVWTECFVLRASHWPIDIAPVIDQWVENGQPFLS